MRALHKAWQDRRPGFTRRVRWYEGRTIDGGVTIRLQMEEYGEVSNLFFNDRDEAQRVYDEFVAVG